MLVNERLLRTYGQQACEGAYENAVRIGLVNEIWKKLFRAIKIEQGDSYLKSYKFIVLKDTEYKKAGDTVYYTHPHYGYIHLGNEVYTSHGDIQRYIRKGELYPTILINEIGICKESKKLFEMNGTKFEEE